MHIITADRGWQLLGGPMKPMPKPVRTWSFSAYNPEIVASCLDARSSQMNVDLVRQFEAKYGSIFNDYRKE